MTSAVIPLHPLGTKRRSALQTFTECQYRWDQIYRQGVLDESAEAKRGTTFHACAKHYVQALFAARETQNLDLARDAFTAGVVESPCPAHLLDDVDQLFWRWAEIFELDLHAYLLSEENPPDPDGFQLRIDLAYAKGDVIEMPDWKTHWAIWSQARVKDSFQAKFYAARARRIWPGFHVYRVVMVFVRFNAPVAVEFTAADLDRFDIHNAAIEDAQLAAIAQHADTGEPFQATPGDHCGYCSLACPAADDLRIDPVRATTLEEAQGIGGEILALTQAIGARRAVLQEYTAINGPVDVGGAVFAHSPHDSKKFPIGAVVDVLRNHDVPPIAKIGSTPIKSFLTAKKWKHVALDLEDLAMVETKTKFGVRRSAVAPPDDAEGEE